MSLRQSVDHSDSGPIRVNLVIRNTHIFAYARYLIKTNCCGFYNIFYFIVYLIKCLCYIDTLEMIMNLFISGS
jgi:hypothetical protein